MKAYTGYFWNGVLPVGLTLLMFLGASFVFYDIVTVGRLQTWLGWTGLGVEMLAVITFFGFKAHLSLMDEKR